MRLDRLAGAAILFVLSAMVYGTLPAGTPVPLVLLRKLSSGGAKAGAEIPMLVAEDVKDEKGAVVIRKGAWAVGVVSVSKGLGLLSLPGSHARLDLRPLKTWTVDGKEVPLQADSKDPKAAHIFTRDNTGKPQPIPGLDKLWADKHMQELLTQASEALGETKPPEWVQDPKKRQEFVDAAKQMDLAKASEITGANQIGQVYSLVRSVQGASIAKLATGANVVSALTVQATLEMARLADSVQSQAAGVFKKRNIVAHVGTPVTAYVAKPVAIALGHGCRTLHYDAFGCNHMSRTFLLLYLL